MFKRLLVLILSLLLIGCAGRPKTVDIPVGDYTGTIPSSWKEKDGYYYCSKVGKPPYMFITVDDDYDFSEFVSDPDPFLDGVVEELDGDPIGDLISVSGFDMPVYLFNLTAEIDGYETLNFIYCLENPSGGTIFVWFMSMDDQSDSYEKFIEMMKNLR